ncbi:MAG: hypothetical protein IIT65_04820 [Lachnospiraceae bacterium]|nr:hypothetical protein [Lachnospiraceae bacterium]
MVEQEKIVNITNIIKTICISEIFLIYINFELNRYYLKYYPKNNGNSFYIGIKADKAGEAKKKLVRVLNLIKRAQSKKAKDEFLVIIDNDAKLLSEITFEDEEKLITGD